jgi:hypothetical protein
MKKTMTAFVMVFLVSNLLASEGFTYGIVETEIKPIEILTFRVPASKHQNFALPKQNSNSPQSTDSIVFSNLRKIKIIFCIKIQFP